MTTKVDIINGAYSQLRISGLTVQPTPEDMQLALNRYENMMSELELRGICLGYNFEVTPDPNSDTGVLHGLNHFQETNLAVRMQPDFDKTLPTTLVFQASQSLATASKYSALNNPAKTPYPGRMPIGNANNLRYSRWNKFYPKTAIPDASCSGSQMHIGDVGDFYEDFHTYLSGETIASYTIDSTTGLTVSNDAINGERIDYRVTVVNSTGEHGNLQAVTIVMTTNTGRITTRDIEYRVLP